MPIWGRFSVAFHAERTCGTCAPTPSAQVENPLRIGNMRGVVAVLVPILGADPADSTCSTGKGAPAGTDHTTVVCPKMP